MARRAGREGAHAGGRIEPDHRRGAAGPARRAAQGRRSVRARPRRRGGGGTGAGRRAVRGRAWRDVGDRRAGARRHSGDAPRSVVGVRRRAAATREAAYAAVLGSLPPDAADRRRAHGHARERAGIRRCLERRRVDAGDAGGHRRQRVTARPARLDRDARDARRRRRRVAPPASAGVIVIGHVVSLATATQTSAFRSSRRRHHGSHRRSKDARPRAPVVREGVGHRRVRRHARQVRARRDHARPVARLPAAPRHLRAAADRRLAHDAPEDAAGHADRRAAVRARRRRRGVLARLRAHHDAAEHPVALREAARCRDRACAGSPRPA